MYLYANSATASDFDACDIKVSVVLDPCVDSEGRVIYSSDYVEVLGYDRADAVKVPLSDPGEMLNAQLRVDLNEFLDDCEDLIQEQGFQILTQFDSLVSSKSRYFVIVFGEPGKELVELGFEICVTEHPAKRSVPKDLEDQINEDPRVVDMKEREGVGYMSLKLREIIIGGSIGKNGRSYTWQDALDTLEGKLAQCRNKVKKLHNRRTR